ncbi:MAG: ABC transporter ATP-binding protein [Lachnospiraceae bacterium]|nr:ABC transporter ATP-binding protein [Lachnospiraceae bacterium]
MKKLLVYLKDYKKETVLAPLFKMLEATFELFVPLVMADIIDVGIAHGDRHYIYMRCLLLVVLGIIGLTCSLTAQYFAAKAAVGFAAGMKSGLYRHIQSLSFTELDTLGASTMITRMTSDANQVQNGVNMVLRLFLRSPFIVFGAMVMAFTIDVKAALIFVVTIPLLCVVVFGIMAISIPLYRKVQAGLDQVLGITRENLTGARVIRAFHKEESEIARFDESNDHLTAMQNYVGRISALMNPITYVIINLATVVLIYVGAVQVNTGSLTQGNVVALVNYMSQILVELIKLANLIVTVTKAAACANRIQSVFDMQPSMDKGGAAGEAAQSTKAERRSDVGTGETKEQAHTAEAESRSDTTAVRFSHVSLCYHSGGEAALEEIDFSAERGQTIGIIGGTGSGKSSVVNMIPRFYDASEGSVLVDGKDVRDYSVRELREKIGVVLQKAVLFQGTIRENLKWGKEDASDEELWEALTLSQAADFVREKEGQLDAQIEQGGKNLSGGQRQRLTIARALVKKPEILILDDSASALDYATDAKLRSAIKGMDGNTTVFIVSQRTASIMHADRILVLDDGRLAGIGTHEQLLAQCEVYREIYESQFKKEAAEDSREGVR